MRNIDTRDRDTHNINFRRPRISKTRKVCLKVVYMIAEGLIVNDNKLEFRERTNKTRYY